MRKNNLYIDKALELGFDSAAVIEANKIVTDICFRKMCEDNLCGLYGKCWMCPPDIGEINLLIEETKKFSHAFVYKKTYSLEDGFDVEGMWRAKDNHRKLSRKIRVFFESLNIKEKLFLGTGGCGICKECAKKTNEVCRYPNLAISSLEAYGIDVAQLAESAGMKYISGYNTVSYFGLVLFNIE